MFAEKCHVIDISQKEISVEYDFDSLIPETECDDLEELVELATKQKQSQGMDVLPLDLYNQMLENCLSRSDYRTSFWLTAMSNFGLRYSDVVNLRRIDLIDENNRLRDRVLLQESKTSKQRVVFINKAVKMALLMHLWHSDITPTDYLITSNGRRKGYLMETYIDSNGKEKAVRINGKYVYKTDDKGNKIPKPLSRSSSEKIMKHIIIDNLGVAIANDTRCKNVHDCIGKICTHSIRKLYGWAITEAFINQFDSDEAYAHAAALSFLSQDYGHSSEAMTLHYSKDFENQKKKIVMNMNIGLSVLEKYFNQEYENRGGGNKCPVITNDGQTTKRNTL